MNVDIGGVSLATIIGVTSPWALLAATFYLIITGKLVPRSTLEDVINDRNAWRETSSTCMEIQREQSDQLDSVVSGLQALDALMRAQDLPLRRRT